MRSKTSLVREPGLSNPYDLQGFHAIGIGTDIALGRLLWLEVDRNDPLEEVLYDAFDAKASAEIISGVGYEWDAKVLVPDQPIVSVPDRIKDVIDKLFSVRSANPFRTFDNDEVPPKTWRSILRKFSKGILVDKLSEPDKE